MQVQHITRDLLAALALAGAKPAGRPNQQGVYPFRCIRHDDTSASAWFGDARWGCSACGFEEPLSTLCESLGVEKPKFGYTIEEYSDLKNLPLPKLASWGVETADYNGRSAVRIPYRDPEGKELRARFRGPNGVWWGPGAGIYPYGLWMLERNPKHPIVFVEGESDCHCAWLHGVLAIGLPGASSWRKDWAPWFRGRTVYVWQEPDKSGVEFVSRLAVSFPEARVLKATTFKDIADIHKKHPDDAAFREVFDRMIREAHPVGVEPPNVQFDSITGDTLDRLLEEKERPVDAIPTPLGMWNALCRDEGGGEGLARGWHVIIGGKPGFGKSVVALNLAAHAIEHGERVCFVSLEMSQQQLVTRLLAMVSGIAISELEKGKHFKRDSYQQARYAMDALYERTGGRVFVNRGLVRSLKDIDQAVRYQHAVNGVGMVITDYMQLAWTGRASGILDRVTEVSKTLRDNAVELGVVNVGLSQFNRETTSSREQPPTSQGLMGGSVLENDADQIALLDHSTYTDKGATWHTNLILDKNRHGRCMTIPIGFSRGSLKLLEDTAAVAPVR